MQDLPNFSLEAVSSSTYADFSLRQSVIASVSPVHRSTCAPEVIKKTLEWLRVVWFLNLSPFSA